MAQIRSRRPAHHFAHSRACHARGRSGAGFWRRYRQSTEPAGRGAGRDCRPGRLTVTDPERYPHEIISPNRHSAAAAPIDGQRPGARAQCRCAAAHWSLPPDDALSAPVSFHHVVERRPAPRSAEPVSTSPSPATVVFRSMSTCMTAASIPTHSACAAPYSRQADWSFCFRPAAIRTELGQTRWGK